jgi:predicted HicB family RNase H-like nuclease
MNVTSYKGGGARIEFDVEDEIPVGHLIGIWDIVGLHADDAAGIRKAKARLPLRILAKPGNK